MHRGSFEMQRGELWMHHERSWMHRERLWLHRGWSWVQRGELWLQPGSFVIERGRAWLGSEKARPRLGWSVGEGLPQGSGKLWFADPSLEILSAAPDLPDPILPAARFLAKARKAVQESCVPDGP